MSLIVKLIISLVIAVIASVLTGLLLDGNILNLPLLAAFCIATAATALIVGTPSNSAQPASTTRTAAPAAKKPAQSATAGDSGREQGEVKWFNTSKGFGFIVMDNGEEIFVHFRSIRGEGRRGLRDGQRVSFVVAQSDKGPQAEDVEGID